MRFVAIIIGRYIPMQSNIKKDYFWNTLGVFAQNAISPLLLIVITRINGIYDSGLFSFAFSLAILFWAISMWGGRTYQVSDTTKEFSNQNYIAVRLILAVVVFIGAFLFSVANGYDAAKTGLIMLLVGLKLVESVADVIYGVFQKNDKLYITGKSLTYKAFIGLGVFIVLDIITGNILLGAFGLLVVNLLFLVFYDIWKIRKIDTISIKKDALKTTFRGALRIIKICAPVFAMTLLAMLSLNIPRYFIDMYHENEIGYFGIISMPITLIVLVMSFILQPNIVRLARLHAENNHQQFNTIIGKVALITFGLGVVVLVATYFVGIQLLELVFGVPFANYQQALLIIVFGALINAFVAILMNALVVMRKIKAQFYILVLTSIALVVASAIFIEQSGLQGGVILFAVVSMIQVLLLGVVYGSARNKAGYAKEN